MNALDGMAAFGAWCDAWIVGYERDPRAYYWLGWVWIALLVGTPLATIGLHASTLYRPGPVVAFFDRILELPFRPILSRIHPRYSDNGVGYLGAVLWFLGLMGASEFYAVGRPLTGRVVLVILAPILLPLVGLAVIEPIQRLAKKAWGEAGHLLHGIRYRAGGWLRDARYHVERGLHELRELLRPARIRAWLRNLRRY